MSSPSDYKPPYPPAVLEIALERYEFLPRYSNKPQVCFLMQTIDGGWCTETNYADERDGAFVWNTESYAASGWTSRKVFHILPPLIPVEVIAPPDEGDSPGLILFKSLAANANPSTEDKARLIKQRIEECKNYAIDNLQSKQLNLSLICAIEALWFSNESALLNEADVNNSLNSLLHVSELKINNTNNQPVHPLTNLVRKNVQAMIGTDDQPPF